MPARQLSHSSYCSSALLRLDNRPTGHKWLDSSRQPIQVTFLLDNVYNEIDYTVVSFVTCCILPKAYCVPVTMEGERAVLICAHSFPQEECIQPLVLATGKDRQAVIACPLRCTT